MPKKILFSVINDYVGDRRIQRIAGFLKESGYEVEILCRELPDSMPADTFGYPVRRLKLWFIKGKFFYIAFTLRLFWKLLFSKADILVANDLDTLLPNFLVSKIRKIPLVYDSHEYYTESPEIIHRPLIQKIWLAIERWIFPKLRQAYTVNASIAKIYTEMYGVPVQIVRNLPVSQAMPSYHYPEKIKTKVLLYQGALNLGRGIERMIEMMEYLPEYQLWIIGKGDIETALKEQAKNAKNVTFWGFQKPADLSAFTVLALLGLSLEEDLGKNYHYASPNKIVDYIQTGVPYCCSDLPEMCALTETYQTGVVIPAEKRTPKLLAETIRNITENEEIYHTLYTHCTQAAPVLCWENEQDKVKAIFDAAH